MLATDDGFLSIIWTTTCMWCCPPSQNVLLSSISWYTCGCLMVFCGESGLQLICAAVLHLMIYLLLADGFFGTIWTTTHMRSCPPSHDMPATSGWIFVQNVDYSSYVFLSSISWYAICCLMDFCRESGLQLVCVAVLHLMICLQLPDRFGSRIWTTSHMCCAPPSQDMPDTDWWSSVQNLDYNLYVLLSSVWWYACLWLMDFSAESRLQHVCACVLHLMIYLPLTNGFLYRIWTTTHMRCCPPSPDMPATAWLISV